MGAGGLAAAAGIGAIVVGLGAAVKIGREAVTAFDAIGKSADTLNLSTDAYQALTLAAAEQGVTESQLETGTRALTERTVELARSQGELFSRLKDTHPELLKQLAVAKDGDARFRLVTAAIQGATTETERNTIAYAAFGEVGLDVTRMLERQEGGFDGLVGRMKETGLVMEEDVIRRAEDLKMEADAAAMAIDLNLKRAFIDLAPVLTGTSNLLADVTGWMREALDGFNDIDDRAIKTIENRAARLEVRLQAQGVNTQTGEMPGNRAFAEEKREFQELLELRAELGDRREGGRQRTFANDRQGLSTDQIDAEIKGYESALESIETAIAARISARSADVGDGFMSSAVKAAIEAEIRADFKVQEEAFKANIRILEDQKTQNAAAAAFEFGSGTETGTGKGTTRPRDNRQQAARFLLQQNDPTLAIKLAQEEINALVEEGLLTEQQGIAAKQEAAQALVNQTPAMKANLELQREWDKVAADQLRTSEKNTEEYEKQTAALAEAIALDAQRFNQAFETPEASRERQLGELDDFASAAADNGTPLDPEAIALATKEIEEGYKRASEAASDFQGTQYAIEDGLMGLIDGTMSFEDAWRGVMRQAIMEVFGVQDTITELAGSLRGMLDDMFGGSGGIGGFIGGLFGAATGGGGGAVAVNHTGRGSYGASGGYRSLNFGGSGIGSALSPGESLSVVQDREMIFQPEQLAAMTGGPSAVYHIDARGADNAGLARLEAMIKQQGGEMRAAQRAMPGQIRSTMRDQFARTGGRP